MKVLLSFAIPVLCAGLLNATTIQVPSDQPTIQAGIDAASDWDTVMVGPGVWVENLHYWGKTVVVISSEGADHTTLRPANGRAPAVLITNGEAEGTQFSGFTVSGGISGNSVLIDNGAYALISENIFRDQHRGIRCDVANATITRNVFMDHAGQAGLYIIDWPNNSKIMNNVFDGSTNAAYFHTYVPFYNNIIVNCSIGIVNMGGIPSVPPADYNLFWNNDTNWNAEYMVGPNYIIADPKFISGADNNYRLQWDSPGIDSGNPDSSYNDPDGTRNDIGIFPFNSCCEGLRGNVDNDALESVDISDLVYFIDYAFENGPSPVCFYEADVDGSTTWPIDISDLVYLVSYMFSGGPAPSSCP